MPIPILNTTDLIEIADKNNLQVEDVIDQYNLKNIRCQNNTSYIININNRIDPMGHWTALFINNGTAHFFDSFAAPPPKYVLDFVKREGYKCVWNTNDIQFLKDVSCGFFCLAFIHFMQHGRGSMDDFSAMFWNDTRKNVKVLQHYVKSNFNIK